MTYENSLTFARTCDQNDTLHSFRDRFYIPQVNGKDSIYLCGNSLGLQPKTVRAALEQELLDWQNLGVEGHFHGKNPWFKYHELFSEKESRIVGAQPGEVVVMNNLTTNLHLMLVSFYQPTPQRYRIITESGAFPSDQYALETQVKFHGYSPEDVIIELKPRAGECNLRTSDIEAVIADNAGSLALVLLGGINYYTGQVFDLAAITKAGHTVGALVGFDLAHAAGNVILQLHDWDVDFAVWCTYKYLNSGPGGVGAAFVHEKHASNPDLPRFAGWWGHSQEERFQMKKGFIPMIGAAGWQLSNGAILTMAAHKAALDIFDEAGMPALRRKSEQLTSYLEFLIQELRIPENILQIITPSESAARGCQLSLLIHQNGRALFEKLTAAGVILDWREPNVIRVAPVPLYNTFEDVYCFAKIFRKSWAELNR
ncbi:kynureninase [Adhaeribacter radiodurans]|uniref:Kynureninase n=1 Tax=Adhaeribacter radiodurans TaxID=2745197 RepID=A0A7L7LA03_9BACT|nr:kynureninase [Adhaeribacter radiodurans]QMU29658.1 kynureninase [Adhaeribacter radiodurans]